MDFIVSNILLLLFIVFTIFWIVDFITTHYVIKLGGYETRELCKYVADKAIPAI